MKISLKHVYSFPRPLLKTIYLKVFIILYFQAFGKIKLNLNVLNGYMSYT